jgi:hypothetical protein
LWEAENVSNQEVNQKEIEFIKLHKSNNPQIGYNQWPKSCANSGDTNPAAQENEIDWEMYLKNNLEFPFWAEVSDFQEKGILNLGDKVKVHEISGSEDVYGVITKVKLSWKTYHFPLYDLAPIDKNSKNHQLIEIYKTTYGNI